MPLTVGLQRWQTQLLQLKKARCVPGPVEVAGTSTTQLPLPEAATRVPSLTQSMRPKRHGGVAHGAGLAVLGEVAITTTSFSTVLSGGRVDGAEAPNYRFLRGIPHN